ncbi:MAG: GH25 family lysozyme [Pseudomonadota bacterium]
MQGLLPGGGFAPDPGQETPGIDISHFQGTNINWSELANGEVAFAIMKATEGASYVDPDFAAHVKNADAVNLPVGAYHFFSSGVSGAEQAEHYLKVIAPAGLSLPPVLDFEGSMSSKDYDEAVIFLDIVKKRAGCGAVLYIDDSHYKVMSAKLESGQPIWLAAYTSRLPDIVPASELWFWQHSERGTFDGVGGDVDSDYFFGSPRDLKKIKCNP